MTSSMQSSVSPDFRAKWKCPIHANEGMALDIIGFCYVHDTYICQDCSFDHMMCEPRVLLIDLQKRIILHGKELKEQVVNVKKDYEKRLVKVTEMRAYIKKEMAEKINFFNTLVEEIKQAMQEHSDYVEKELDDAVEKISYFPALCEQNISILDILGQKCDLRKVDPDIFKRFCTSFDKELGQMQVPIERMETETTQIKTSSAQFSNYVSETGMPIRAIRDQIVFSSKLQNKHLIEAILKKKLEEKKGNLTEAECQKIFEDFIKGLKLYSAPSKEKVSEAFKSYEFLAPNDIPENIAVEAVMQSMQELQKEVRAVTQNEIVQSQVLLA
eukprot:TRINITY_DN384_c0_g3_i2.p1 TRINITY_DN384_c0_g3~~TRINITY_DN384_c0_g3_i2.p1  ORF type:complete len:328 (+),score=131.27 TRINITY_DN384_c0_g3_i2:107-1090(+)